MNRLDEMKPGAKVRHMQADIDGAIVKVQGDFIWVQATGGGEAVPSLMGFWEVIEAAPNQGGAA